MPREALSACAVLAAETAIVIASASTVIIRLFISIFSSADFSDNLRRVLLPVILRPGRDREHRKSLPYFYGYLSRSRRQKRRLLAKELALKGGGLPLVALGAPRMGLRPG